MHPRRFLLTSLAEAVAAPLLAGAQQKGKAYRVAFLGWTRLPELAAELVGRSRTCW